ncbi:MAG: hypothetical protein WD557_01330, partial [Dehalococcoidia bacterium]
MVLLSDDFLYFVPKGTSLSQATAALFDTPKVRAAINPPPALAAYSGPPAWAEQDGLGHYHDGNIWRNNNDGSPYVDTSAYVPINPPDIAPPAPAPYRSSGIVDGLGVGPGLFDPGGAGAATEFSPLVYRDEHGNTWDDAAQAWRDKSGYYSTPSGWSLTPGGRDEYEFENVTEGVVPTAEEAYRAYQRTPSPIEEARREEFGALR